VLHRVNHIHPQPSPQVHTIDGASRSEDTNSLISGNHDEFHGVQEISIIILVMETYLTIIQQLSTHTF
jgi:hypothetical protein